MPRLVLPSLVISLAMIFADQAGFWDVIECRLQDLRFRIRGDIPVHPNLALVVANNEDFQEYGPWPFSNQIQGKFIEAVTNFGASALVYDAMFSRPTQPKADAFFRKMAKQSARVYFPLRFSPYGEAIPLGDSSVPSGILRQQLDHLKPQNGMLVVRGLLNLPMPGLDTVAKSMGFVQVRSDDDGVVRRTPLLLACDSSVFPHLDLQVWAKHARVDLRSIRFHPLILRYQNDKTLSLDGSGQMLINWPCKWNQIPKYSFHRILSSYQAIMDGRKPDIPIDSMLALQDKIVLVGVTDKASYETVPTPLENQYPVPGVQFAILNTLLTGNPVVMVSFFIRSAILLVLMAFLVILLHRNGFGWQLTAGGLALSILFVSQWLFQAFSISLPVVAMLVGSFLLIMYNMVSSYYEDRRAKTKVENMFARYLTKEVMDELIESPEWTEVGGRKVVVSVLFSDIRGFTTISELNEPKRVVDQLNEYLAVMTPIIFANKGTIDKIIGDEIMAYFGAPLFPEMHAWRAVKAAMEMQEALSHLREKWRIEGKPDMQIGIGVNTGSVIMGNIGTEQYMNFTLLGDSVNLGARLCAAASPGEILISSGTYQEVYRRVVVAHSRETTVKGKMKPVRVYSVTGALETEAKDKRQFERFEVSLPIRIWRADGSNEAAWLVDIGGGGFCCIASGDWSKGEIIALALQLPNGIEIREAKARLVDTALIEEGLRLKAEFVSINDADREEIIKMARLFGEDSLG
ncbi:MAG TPA: CHASE2 domain-containing protein [Fibrobacteraceae bacterium]|nr:CHASE2 domain-containing protein [Fibrobacteraceae bacterium]